MNSLVHKTEVLEKIEESLRPLCVVEDLNDEVMELCTLSNELNACETKATLNPSNFARLGLRESFAVDLTTARGNEQSGTSVFKMTKQTQTRAELRTARTSCRKKSAK